MAISAETLHRLAQERAEAVRVFLETSGGIGSERLFVVEPEDPGALSAQAGEPRVIFNLE
jgi:hypothetical protein